MPHSRTPAGGSGSGNSEADEPDGERLAYDPLLAFETILEDSELT
jgi:hypothetical protein